MYNTAKITRIFFAVAISLDNFFEMFVEKNILAFAFLKMLGAAAKENAVQEKGTDGVESRHSRGIGFAQVVGEGL